jgi:transcriptional regulator with XRE-family HTH domain
MRSATRDHTDSFGYWLRRRRKALDLTQDALAESVSCSASAIRKVETDERRPSKRLAERLADRLGISPAERAAFLEAARAEHSTANLDVDDEPVSATYEHAADPTPESATNADARALGQLRGEVFVGRKNEMDGLGAALEDVLAGHSRLVMLAGEPGIGKTRTAQELSTHALQRNAQVLWGRCYEGKGAPPYWPWVQMIRSAIQDKDAARLQAEMGHGSAAIAGVVPEICDRLPNIAPPPTLDPEQARFRLFDSITTFLKNISKHQPLVLILDDLHWADHPSLRLLDSCALIVEQKLSNNSMRVRVVV